MKEDREGADVSDPPFSEMISRWLDEGDQLHENIAVTPVGTAPNHDRWFHRALALARVGVDRYRVFVLAGVGMIPFVLFVAAHRFASPAIVAVVPAPLGLPATSLAPVGPVAVARAAQGSKPGSIGLEPTTTEVKPPATGARPDPITSPIRTARSPPIATREPLAHTSRPAPSPLQACKAALRRERAGQALPACRRVADTAPRSANALVLLARANLLAGRDNETLRLARRASVMDPRCAEAFLLIGNVDQMIGRKSDARAAYGVYLHMTPRGHYAADVRAIIRTL